MHERSRTPQLDRTPIGSRPVCPGRWIQATVTAQLITAPRPIGRSWGLPVPAGAGLLAVSGGSVGACGTARNRLAGARALTTRVGPRGALRPLFGPV